MWVVILVVFILRLHLICSKPSKIALMIAMPLRFNLLSALGASNLCPWLRPVVECIVKAVKFAAVVSMNQFLSTPIISFEESTQEIK